MQAPIMTDMRDPRELKPHPDNPRGEIDPDSDEISRLADDIAKHKIIQPLVINSKGQILAGHRRRVAAIRAGLDEVPVVYRELSGSEFIEEIFLSENMQRQDLSPLEEARAIAAVKSKWEKQTKNKVTTADLARRTQIPTHTIRARLNILQLPGRIQNLFHICELPVNSATQLARLAEWPEEVEKFADRMVTRQITSASLDALITRRMHELQRTADNEATLNRKPKLARVKQYYPENSHTPVLTRKVVVENLAKRPRGSVTIFNLTKIFDATCCSCGLMGTESVCLSCPLPRFVNGLIGRADNTGDLEDDE